MRIWGVWWGFGFLIAVVWGLLFEYLGFVFYFVGFCSVGWLLLLVWVWFFPNECSKVKCTERQREMFPGNFHRND